MRKLILSGRNKKTAMIQSQKKIICGFEIELIRKEISRISIRIFQPDGRIRMSVPLKISDEIIDDYVKKNAQWIVRGQKTMIERYNLAQKNSEYIDGEMYRLWGESYKLKIIENEKHDDVIFDGDVINLTTRGEGTQEKYKKIMIEFYRREIMERVPELIAKWEKIIDVTCKEWHIKKMKTRWGTCNSKAQRIWISLFLAQKPLIALEEIVVHELCHIREGNHGAKFKELMTKAIPNWREIEKALSL